MSVFTAGRDYPVVSQETLTPSAIPAGNTSVETFTPKSLTAIDNTYQVRVEGPSLPAGLRIVNSRMTSTQGQLEITFENFTLSTITPAAQSFNILVF